MRHTHRRLAGLALAAAALTAMGCGGSSPAAEPVPVFTPTGSLGVARADFTATRLSDGRVLVVGGTGGGAVGTSAEVYDPTAKAFTATGGLSSSRAYHVAARLPSGRVLVAGGASTPASAEVYDPAAGTFAVSGGASAGHMNATATGLADGTVIVAAGYAGPATTAAVERYHPGSGTFAAGNLLGPCASHTATLLASGKVLVAGGERDGSTTLATAELYDPAGQTSAVTGLMLQGREGHTATLLPGGKVLLAGGVRYQGNAVALATAELYDSSTGSFAATGSLREARYAHTATLLANGKVLIAGGYDPGRIASNGGILDSAELYDPASGTFSPTATMGTRRAFHAAALLPDGGVLVAGGLKDWSGGAGYLAASEIYR